MMKFIKLLVIMSILSVHGTSNALTFEDYGPISTQDRQWYEGWYNYLYDPQIGFIKFQFLRYRSELTPENTSPGYVHILFAPHTGKHRTYRYYFDHVELGKSESGKPYSFRFQVPGQVEVTDQKIFLNLPEVSATVEISENHKHYWKGKNPGQSPYGGIIGSLPFLENGWLILSLGTDVSYQYQDEKVESQGQGTLYMDNSWGNSSPTSFFYITGVEAEHQLVMASGTDGSLPLDLWISRFVSPKSDLTFRPSLENLTVKSQIDPCTPYVEVEMRSLTHKLKVKASAIPSAFFEETMPPVEVFAAENPVNKTMQAEVEVKHYHWGKLKDEHLFTQAVMEFGGELFCSMGYSK